MLLISFQSLNGHNSASRGARGFQKKGKSSEFNPQNYEHVKSSPSLKVWSHESIKDTVKFDNLAPMVGAVQPVIAKSSLQGNIDYGDVDYFGVVFNFWSLQKFERKNMDSKQALNGHFSCPAETGLYILECKPNSFKVATFIFQREIKTEGKSICLLLGTY